MSADILFILDGSGIAILVTIHTNTVQLRCQTGDTFNHFQVVIEKETAVLQHKDLEECLDGCIADIWSLHVMHRRSFNIIHTRRHNREDDLLTHFANNLRTFARGGFYSLQFVRIQTSCSDQREIGQLPVQANGT